MSVSIHASAIVDEGAQIGEGSRVWHFVHVCGGARIGRGVSLGQNVFVGNKVVIGDHCKIQNNVSVYDNVTLEEGVFCGPSMVFTNVYNPRSLIERKSEYRVTLVGKGATLGANCTIVCGTTIGKFALVGVDLVQVGVLRRSAVSRFKDGVTRLIVDVCTRSNPNAADLSSQRVREIIAIEVQGGNDIVILRAD